MSRRRLTARPASPSVASVRAKGFLFPLGAAALLLAWPGLGSAYWVDQLGLIGIFALVVSGVNLTYGFAGEVQFSQVAIFALGAYIAGAAGARGYSDIVVLTIAAGLAGGLVAALIALPTLRIGGWSLAMASFYLVIALPEIAQIFQRYTGGDAGLTVPIPSVFGASVGETGLYRVVLVALVVWIGLYRNFVRSRYGVVLRLLRESHLLAASLGFSRLRVKVLAYGLGGVPAAAAGCLYAFQTAYVTSDTFDLTLGIGFVAAAVLGGAESVYGALAGAAILQLGPNASLGFQQYAPVVYGAFLILAATVFPRGLAGGADALGSAARRIAHRSRSMARPQGAPGAEAPLEVNQAASSSPTVTPPGSPTGMNPTASLAARGRTTPARLEVSAVTKSFGGVRAVDGVSLVAEPGQVTALVGANGSGKTTMLNVICGFVKADAGSVSVGGVRLTGKAPHRIARSGVARTFQTPSVPRGLSVLEVVASGCYRIEPVSPVAAMLRLRSYRRAVRKDTEAASRALADVGLLDKANVAASSLPLGTRRLLEVARARCGQPSLLLLDEPASGLSAGEIEVLGGAIRGAAQEGAAVIIIEHNFPFVVEIADVVNVLHAGRCIASGSGAAVSRDPAVIESFLGLSLPEAHDRTPDSDSVQVRAGELRP